MNLSEKGLPPMSGKLCGTFLMIQPFPQLPQRLTQGQAHQIAPGAAHHIGNEIGDVAGAVKKGLQQLNGGAADGSLQQCQKKALSCAVRHQDAKRQKEENIQQNLAHTVAPAVEQIPKGRTLKAKVWSVTYGSLLSIGSNVRERTPEK